MSSPFADGEAQEREAGREGKRGSQGFGRDRRLIRPKDFKETFDQGRKRVGRSMILWVREGEGASRRLGVVTSRKVGGAVTRVKVRRRLREVFRRHREGLRPDVDVVLVGRAGAATIPWGGLVDEFTGLARKAGIWQMT
ncbi:MAG TPA: ribonuclease P protein component [Kiritimatiellia bacterium]|nr:ribonuclease P protein component [Kiritimatiellia bacterium]